MTARRCASLLASRGGVLGAVGLAVAQTRDPTSAMPVRAAPEPSAQRGALRPAAARRRRGRGLRLRRLRAAPPPGADCPPPSGRATTRASRRRCSTQKSTTRSRVRASRPNGRLRFRARPTTRSHPTCRLGRVVCTAAGAAGICCLLEGGALEYRHFGTRSACFSHVLPLPPLRTTRASHRTSLMNAHSTAYAGVGAPRELQAISGALPYSGRGADAWAKIFLFV
jgi:hypothetical protein